MLRQVNYLLSISKILTTAMSVRKLSCVSPRASQTPRLYHPVSSKCGLWLRWCRAARPQPPSDDLMWVWNKQWSTASRQEQDTEQEQWLRDVSSVFMSKYYVIYYFSFTCLDFIMPLSLQTVKASYWLLLDASSKQSRQKSVLFFSKPLDYSQKHQKHPSSRNTVVFSLCWIMAFYYMCLISLKMWL